MSKFSPANDLLGLDSIRKPEQESAQRDESAANKKILPLPRKLNLGSGKSWQADFLNLDVNDYWQPDIVADFNKVFPPEGEIFHTERFGPVEVKKGSFSLIIAHDVLEHVRELTTCMTNCLDLLEFGGCIHIMVPHDLSFGAWQDPTHVRAFNERSWLYYTDWFWYLGWEDGRFEVAKLDLNLSDRGKKLLADGEKVDEITATPRAVDAISVTLRKIPLSAADRDKLAQAQQRGPR